MLSIDDNYRAVEKKVRNQLLQDIAQASLHTDFISESPHFFIHVDHSFIEIHIRKDTFSNDHILRNTALDTGILIPGIIYVDTRTLMMKS